MNANIAALDRDLAKDGETVTLQRGAVSLTVPAHVRTVAQDDLVSGVRQGDLKIILSPTSLDDAAWIAATTAGTDPFTPDRRIPRRNEKAIVQGALRTILDVRPIIVGGALVRIELRAKG